MRSDQHVSQTFYVRGTICDNASTSLKLWRTLSGNLAQDVKVVDKQMNESDKLLIKLSFTSSFMTLKVEQPLIQWV